MIELHINVKDLEAALTRLNGSQARLDKIVRDIIPTVAGRVRQDVLGYLDENVALAPQRGALIKRAVKAVRDHAANPELEERAREISSGFFREELRTALDMGAMP